MANNGTKRVVKKTGKAKEEQTEREIIGVCFIAIALFLGAGIYTDLVGVIGTAVKNFCFGMFGMAGYAVPVILVVLGVLSIVMSKSDSAESTLWLLFVGVVCLLVIIHAATRSSISSEGVLSYYSDAYLYGKIYFKGGGLLGALLAYPALLLLGPVGTYIFFGSAILIVFLVATRLSIRAMGEKVGSKIKSGVETVSEKVHTVQARQQVRREIYDFEEMGYEQIFPPKKKAQRLDGKGLYTETLGSETVPAPAKKPRKKADDSHIVRRREDATDWDGDISLIPEKGVLPKRNADDEKMGTCFFSAIP